MEPSKSDTIRNSVRKLRESLKELGNGVETLNLKIKYIQFDLEATRRELKYYKDIVEGNK